MAHAKRQLSFFKPERLTHGGGVARGNPRAARPLSVKRPIHLVMRSAKASGAMSFLLKENSDQIKKIIAKHAKACGVKVYDYANSGNHLHLVVKISRPEGFKKFIRTISGLIARLILKAEKGQAKLKGARFWDARPFTRVASWGRAYDQLKSYLALNKFEALGFVKHMIRDGKRKVFTIKVDPRDLPREINCDQRRFAT